MNINKKIMLSLAAGVVISITSLVVLPQIALAATCSDGTTIPAPEVREDNQTVFCQSHGGYVALSEDTTKPVFVKNDCNGKDIQAGLDKNDPNHCGILDYLTIFINVLSGLVGIIVVISIILGGIQYTASSGDPQKIAAAKRRILNALVAFFAFIFMYAFLQYLIPGGIF